MAPWDRRDSETASTIVGSENGHRLSEQDDATEGTGLLSAGAQQHDGAEDSPLGESIQRKDSWVGMQEFEGLPWHQRPSVCMRLAKTCEEDVQVLSDARYREEQVARTAHACSG